jgi:hypothetical protein
MCGDAVTNRIRMARNVCSKSRKGHASKAAVHPIQVGDTNPMEEMFLSKAVGALGQEYRVYILRTARHVIALLSDRASRAMRS